MRPSLSRLVAISLSAAMLQPGLPTSQAKESNHYEGSLIHERSDLREQMTNFGVDITSRLIRGEHIMASEVPHSMIRRRYQQLAGEDQTIELRDIAQRMAAGADMYVDNWMTGLSLTKESLGEWWFGLEEREARMLRGAKDQLYSDVARQAIIEPEKSVEHIINDALSNIDAKTVKESLEYDWTLHDWSQGIKFDSRGRDTGRDDSNRRNGEREAYIFTYPEDAISLYEKMKHKVAYDHLIHSDVRTAEVSKINWLVRKVRENRDTIIKESLEHDVPIGVLGYVLGMYRPENPMPRIVSNNQSQQQHRSKLEVTLQRMVDRVIEELPELYKADAFVIAARGATPFGTLLGMVMEEAGVEKKPIYNLKFGRQEKLVEAYANTQQYGGSEKDREVLLHIGSLREKEGELRRSRTLQGRNNAREVQEQIDALVEAHQELYDSQYKEVLKYQIECAKKDIGSLEGMSVVAIDDFIRTGKTAQNISDVTERLGSRVEPENVVTLLASGANGNESFFRTADALDEDYKKNKSWMEAIPWRELPSRLVYGIEEKSDRANKLFEKRLNTRPYHVVTPKNNFYSAQEQETIAHDFVETFLQHKIVDDQYKSVKDEAVSILKEYGVKETLEGIEKKLGMLAHRFISFKMRVAVRERISDFERQLKGNDITDYILGKDKSIARTELSDKTNLYLNPVLQRI